MGEMPEDLEREKGVGSFDSPQLYKPSKKSAFEALKHMRSRLRKGSPVGTVGDEPLFWGTHCLVPTLTSSLLVAAVVHSPLTWWLRKTDNRFIPSVERVVFCCLTPVHMDTSE